jgi:hypothetical protein
MASRRRYWARLRECMSSILRCSRCGLNSKKPSSTCTAPLSSQAVSQLVKTLAFDSKLALPLKRTQAHGSSSPLPDSVKVGDTANYATLASYTDSSKANTTGTRVLSFVVEADTADTAIVNFITRSYNTASQLMFTQQSRLRMAADGSLTLVSIDVQFSTSSTNRQIYTKA